MRSREYEPSAAIVDPGIGGGHPYYGLVLAHELRRKGIEPRWISARKIASDTLAKYYWRAVYTAYRFGGMGGILTEVYERSREDSKRRNPALAHAQEDLARYLNQYDGVNIATHAHTAVKTRSPLVLIQGDLHGGKDYAIPEADYIAVPTDISKSELLAQGIPEDKIRVVGYFVDKTIKDETIVQKRLEQLRSGNIHVGIFFTGALPREHVRLTRKTLLPNLAPLMRKKQVKVSLYTFTSKPLADAFLEQGRQLGLKGIKHSDDAADGNWDMQVLYDYPATKATERLLSVVGDSDNPVSMVVTMPGERFPWSVGVPIFPFVPINKTNAGGNTEWAIKNGIMPPIAETSHIDELIANRKLTDLEVRLLRAQEFLPTDGAENTVNIVRNFLT